jgi:nitroreductase
MDVIEAIHGRRSIRSFEPRAPDRETLEALIWDAAQAPPPAIRAVKRQAFVVITGAERLADMGERAKAYARSQRADGAAPDWRDDPQFKVFWDAPVLVLVCANMAAVESEWDCCRSGQNLMLSAHARGLGSCWVGAPLAWLRSPPGAATARPPAGFIAVAPILVGYPKTTPAPRAAERPEVVWA